MNGGWRYQLSPLLMGWLLFLVQYAALYGAGERGFTLRQCAWLGVVNPVAYFLASLIAAATLTPRQARRVTQGATLACLLCGVACVWARSFPALLVGLAALGFAAPFFYIAFQTLLRELAPHDALERTVGPYILALGVGAGIGYLSSGACYRGGPRVLAGIVVLLGAAIGWRLRRLPRAPGAGSAVRPAAPPPSLPPHPAAHGTLYVRIGWMCFFMSGVIQRTLYTFVPVLGARARIEPFWVGVSLGLFLLAFGVSGLVLARRPQWLYRQAPLWLWHGAAVAGCLALGVGAPLGVQWIAFGALGLYGGCVGFMVVYYASHSRRRARDLGLNEAVASVGGLAGVFGSGAWLKHTPDAASLYLLLAVAIAGTALAQGTLAVAAAKKSSK